MIKRVRIQNFRSCKDTAIENIPNLVALIGRNGAGKTNVLRAIDWLARMATQADYRADPSLILGYVTTNHVVEVEVSIASRTYYYRLEREKLVDNNKVDFSLNESLSIADEQGLVEVFQRCGQQLTSALRKDAISLNRSTGSLVAILSVLPGTDPVAEAVRPLYVFLRSVRYHSIDDSGAFDDLDDQSSFISKQTYDDWLNRFDDTGNPRESVPLRILHLWLSSTPKFRQLCDLVGKMGLNLISHLIIKKLPEGYIEHVGLLAYQVLFRPSAASTDHFVGFDYTDLSTGTRRILRILVSLLYDSSAVMLLEHPEDGIHAGLLKDLIDMLKTDRDETQIIMTSHSLTTLNELAPDQIRLVTMDEGQTKVRSLKPKEKRAAREYMEQHGTFAEFLELVQESEIAK